MNEENTTQTPNPQTQQTEETPPVAATPTAGARQKIPASTAFIKRTAEKAAETGKRADLMEYLKARRVR